MIASNTRVPPPSQDKRWKIVDATMRRNGYSRNALIETLHTVQSSFGFLDKPSLRYVATSLSVPLSAVYGVATFYHLFSLKPPGEHTCVVCTGTACYIKGSSQMLDHIAKRYGITDGQTTEDNKLSLMTARCIGACSMAPAVVLDGQMEGEVDHAQLDNTLDQWVNQ